MTPALVATNITVKVEFELSQLPVESTNIISDEGDEHGKHCILFIIGVTIRITQVPSLSNLTTAPKGRLENKL